MNRRRVALVALHFAEYAANLALALAEKWEVLLVLYRDHAEAQLGSGWADTLGHSGLTLLVMERPNSVVSILGNAKRLTGTVQRFEPDVIHYPAATGISLYEKPWSKGLLKFLACFVPPGSPSHVFGDAAETKPFIPNLNSYASRYDDNLALWYSQNLIGNEDAFTVLTHPVLQARPSAIGKPPEENACFFKHIGWVGMHSRWADRNRTSVYFKSSPYGSFNHSHADQNSFTLVAASRSLLIDSGVYDWYGSPHWKNWYRQTAAHNAITFDNGKGQVTESAEASMSARGKITRFEISPDVDFVEGDATRAYGGKLTKATRKLWFIRSEEALVILDDVASDQNRSFEWNAHALSNFRRTDTDTYEIRSGDQTACLDFLSPRDSSVRVTEGVPVPPNTRISKSWHLRYEDSKATKSSLFVVAIRVNCAAPRARLDEQNVIIGNVIINLTK